MRLARLKKPLRPEVGISFSFFEKKKIHLIILFVNFEFLGAENNTLFILTSDNGGALEFGSSNGPFRGQKNDCFEGGVKVFTYLYGDYLKQHTSNLGIENNGNKNVKTFITIGINHP